VTDFIMIAEVLAIGIVLCAAAYLFRAGRVWHRLRSERLVTCPETGYPAAVRIDVPHAAMSDLVHGTPELRLAACSRWPQRGPCDEACMCEAVDPHSTVASVAAQWFEGQTCVYCRKLVHDDVAAGHHVAVLGADGITHEWCEGPAAVLPDALRTGRPVCWNCHVAETFRRTFPELVTDRAN
jgi:hypothetical protein